ncbi:MAG: type II secretion system major pseudopilin GspG [Planctomycetota bacterium]|jgi:general secretion pathway protein G|nr:type II secretion system major pseudopilin GspG [Planctomycetota bacterium]
MHLPSTRRRARRTARRGFSLLELLIVIGIILAIGGLVAVNLLGQQERADSGTTRIQIQNLNTALEQFKVDLKRFPSEDEGLAVLWDKELLEDESDLDKWQGPYLSQPVVRDMWGSEWVYRNPSEIEGVAYDIVSVGPDKEEGTDDDLSSNDARMDADGEMRDEFSDFAPSGG